MRPHPEPCIDIKGNYTLYSPGTVRLCPHLVVQVIHEEPEVGRYWRDINPILNPIRHRRAFKAVKEALKGGAA